MRSLSSITARVCLRSQEATYVGSPSSEVASTIYTQANYRRRIRSVEASGSVSTILNTSGTFCRPVLLTEGVGSIIG